MIAIVKYGAGNIGSVQNALNRLGYKSVLTDDIDMLMNADKVILPGVGQAKTAMSEIETRGLRDTITKLEQPFLGICLGMQLLCQYSEEGDTECLGVFDCDVRKFPSGYIVPHMGWNSLSSVKGDLFIGMTTEKSDVYYVHSYYAEMCESTIAVTDYCLPFSAALQKRNFYATQFHPEKSGDVGELILKNFLEL